MKLRTIAVLLCLTPLVSLSCSNDDKPTKPDPATPFPCVEPPLATMQVDTSDLDQGGVTDRNGSCHALSGPIVPWVDAVLVFPFAIPVGAFNACLLRDPVYIGDGTWQWTAAGGVGEQEHADELTAHLLPDGKVAWSMRVSGTQYDLARFLWVDGTCDTAATQGSWHFYDRQSQRAPRELLRIDWTVHAIPGGSTLLSLESVDSQAVHFGDRLLYETSAVQGKMTFLDLGDLGVDTLEIRWSWLNGSGTAIAATRDTCCWADRPLYRNVGCP